MIGVEYLDIQRDASAKLPLESDKSVAENEYDRILQTLEETHWNRRQTAKKLDLPYSTLRFKMERLGIS